jgi:hypothetical protein
MFDYYYLSDYNSRPHLIWAWLVGKLPSWHVDSAQPKCMDGVSLSSHQYTRTSQHWLQIESKLHATMHSRAGRTLWSIPRKYTYDIQHHAQWQHYCNYDKFHSTFISQVNIVNNTWHLLYTLFKYEKKTTSMWCFLYKSLTTVSSFKI